MTVDFTEEEALVKLIDATIMTNFKKSFTARILLGFPVKEFTNKPKAT